jgi:protein TonB
MPQEFLRDVVRSDQSGRRQRRLSVLPVSIAAHAVVIVGVLLSPIVGTLDLPAIASPLSPEYIPTVPPPPSPPPPATATPPAPRNIAPIEAPPEIGTETPRVELPSNVIDGGIEPIGPAAVSGPLLSALSTGPTVSVTPPSPPPTPKVHRVGGVIREPKKLVHVAPIYPDIARNARIDGVVVMEALLDDSGEVDSVRILKSVPLLDDAAVRAVKQWRYTPTELNGVPVPVLMTITVRFSLER